MSLKTKLTILFLAIAVIPLAFVSALTFHNYQDSMKTAHLNDLQHIAAAKADKIETYFSFLKIYFERTQVAYVIRKNFSVLTRLAATPGDPEFIEAKKMIDGVYRNLPRDLGLVDVMLADPQGRMVYSSNPEHSPKDFLNFQTGPQQEMFAEGKKKICFSDIFSDKDDQDRPTLLITGPAVDLNGDFSGVIVAEVDMAPIYQFIQDTTGLGRTGETLVGKKFGNEVIYLNPLRHDPGAALNRRVIIGNPKGLPIQNAVRGKIGAGELIDYRGKKVIAAWRYLPSLQWGIVAKIDSEEAFKGIVNLRNLVVIILLIVSVLAAIMAFSIAQSIAGPIQKLSKGAEIIGKGNLDHKVGMPLKDEVGQLSRAFDKMVQDLKEASASRALERQRLFDVLETLPVYVVLLTEDYHVPFANKFFRERFGESNGKRCYEYLFNRTEPCENCETYKVMKTGAKHHWEWTGPDGRDYDIHDFPFTDTNGSKMIMEMGIDITERKKAEAELRRHRDSLEVIVAERTAALQESEQRVRRKLDSVLSPEGNIGDLELSDIMDAKNIQVLMDDFYEISHIPMAIIDLKGKTLAGAGWQDVCTKFHRVHPETSQFCVESDTQLTAAVKPGEFKLYKCKNCMWDAATPLIIGGKKFGNLFMGQFFFVDEKIDYEAFRAQAKRYGFDEKKYIAALDAAPRLTKNSVKAGMEFLEKIAHMISTLSYSNIELARILSQRDNILRALQMSEENLKRSNESLEQFAYVASHDLQEPLRVMSSYSQLLEKRYQDKLDKDGNEFIGFIVDAAKRMQKLITDLLAYSRLGKKNISPEKVDLNKLLDSIIDGMSQMLGPIGGKVTHGELPVLIGYETSMLQLFQNLIGNAVKFRGEASPEVHVTAQKDKGPWTFSVQDNGLGIEPQYHERIFQIFQRLHSREDYPGTGIGLSICKKIVTNLGGRIWVESEHGKGATFYFTIPS